MLHPPEPGVFAPFADNGLEATARASQVAGIPDRPWFGEDDLHQVGIGAEPFFPGQDQLDQPRRSDVTTVTGQDRRNAAIAKEGGAAPDRNDFDRR